MKMNNNNNNNNNKKQIDHTENEEFEFHQHKSSISINNTDINKIVGSNKFPFGKQTFRYFIVYKDTK